MLVVVSLERRSVRTGAANDVVLVEEKAGEFSVYGWNNLDVVIWHGKASADGVRRMQNVVQRRARETGKKMSSVHIVRQHPGMPDREARDEFTKLSREGASKMACFVFLIEGEGFRASAMRGLITGLVTLGSRRYTSHVSRTLREAAQWLPAPHARETGVTLNESELRTALETARDLAQRRATTASVQ